ncbi:MAG: shikimate kinase [Ferruginibacter sp.]
MRIFLLGFMGSGKSRWGKIWADELHIDFCDIDALIEKKEQLSVVDIFEKKGEDHFRIIEASILREQTGKEDIIIACGGGSPCFYNNIQWMNEQGTTVYLQAKPDFLLKNIMDEKEKRPMVKNLNEAELIFFIEQKLKEREPFYSQASLRVNAEELDVNSLSSIITL